MMKIKSFVCPKSIRNYEKKIMLGTSDDWSMIKCAKAKEYTVNIYR